MQARVDWTGPELAARLGVTDRTVRNDIARLRELGYPVDATRGRGGHYRLGVGAKLPPLLLDDEEAVAVAVGLRTVTGIAGFEESGGRALAKLEQVLPDRLRRQLVALRDATSAGRSTPTPTSRTRRWTRPCSPRSRPRSATTAGCARSTGRRAGGDRALPAGRLAAAVVPRRPRSGDERVGAVPASTG